MFFQHGTFSRIFTNKIFFFYVKDNIIKTSKLFNIRRVGEKKLLHGGVNNRLKKKPNLKPA
jgi:hypothetical protein